MKRTTLRRVGLVLGLGASVALGVAASGCAVDVERKLNSCLDRLAKASGEGASGTRRAQSLESALAESKAEAARLRELNELMSRRLAALGQKVGEREQLTAAERRKAEQELEETRRQLVELRKAKARAEERTAKLRDVLRQFAALIKSGKVKVLIRDGRMVVVLESAVLFDSGQTFIKPGGKKALAEITQVLKTMTDRNIQVAGHTDNTPVRGGPFRSNWELSTARAVEVVKLMQSLGLPARQLSAAGYSEFSPVKENTTAEGKAENRRIEIVLQPKLDELPNLQGVFETQD
jgi:chemotaxis protein MotB